MTLPILTKKHATPPQNPVSVMGIRETPSRETMPTMTVNALFLLCVCLFLVVSSTLATTFGSEKRQTRSFPFLSSCCYSHHDAFSDIVNRRRRHNSLPNFSFSSRRPIAFTESQLWAIRTASAVSTYFGFVVWNDRPKGQLMPNNSDYLEAKQSTVPGAGLGLFAKTTMRRGTTLGTYPGVVIPLTQNLNKLRQYPQCEGYTWRFSDNQFVIDPTNSEGNIEDYCLGGNPSMPLSTFLFCNILPFMQVPTTLCRINEPPKGRDVNVITSENIEARSVVFQLERDVYEGEELFIDYGLSYDRSQYGG